METVKLIKIRPHVSLGLSAISLTSWELHRLVRLTLGASHTASFSGRSVP